ncbi:probable mediator of RNA polymerase II transcription subunit 26b [Eucalyptus grandis]|uniref:probable mediator of RNA polymerase II transcription subunit 26b n=1 Tax=Eucalyptus grandis TaxID=71139 RepID=UPI00192EB669|nr:probable mediator of RNA polymerase II transcription subunit 26b [Eucalyptus grandis]
MSKSLDYWRAFFRGTNADVFEFIDNAIAVAAHDLPDDFRSRRGRIMERLYSCETGRHAPSEESEANGDSGVDVEQEAVGMDKESCCSCGEARAFADETDERSRVFGEVLRIKQVLDKSRLEQSASALCESLRRLQSMAITLDILETTKIGISVNSLRRNCRSKQIAQLAHGIIGYGVPYHSRQAYKNELAPEKHDIYSAVTGRNRTNLTLTANQANLFLDESQNL